MSDDHISQGVNSAMLTSMSNHSNQSNVHSGADIGFETPIVNSKISLLASAGEQSIANDLGLGGSMDELFAGINQNAALNRTPITDVGSGTLISPGNINAFGGLHELKGVGDVDLSNASSIEAGLNLAPGISATKNIGRQG